MFFFFLIIQQRGTLDEKVILRKMACSMHLSYKTLKRFCYGCRVMKFISQIQSLGGFVLYLKKKKKKKKKKTLVNDIWLFRFQKNKINKGPSPKSNQNRCHSLWAKIFTDPGIKKKKLTTKEFILALDIWNYF